MARLPAIPTGPDVVTPDTPTLRVGAEPLDSFPTVEHANPMLSLNATRESGEVERFDARATSAVSSETDYVVVGEDPGSKADDAEEHGVETLDEEAFLALIEERGVELPGEHG